MQWERRIVEKSMPRIYEDSGPYYPGPLSYYSFKYGDYVYARRPTERFVPIRLMSARQKAYVFNDRHWEDVYMAELANAVDKRYRADKLLRERARREGERRYLPWVAKRRTEAEEEDEMLREAVEDVEYSRLMVEQDPRFELKRG